MIKAVAIDNEPLALSVISAFCADNKVIVLKELFTRTDLALLYLVEEPVDLVFLDINMPAMSGIEFCKKIPHQTMVVFTTAYSEYAVEGFNLNAIDYLLKPFTKDRFDQAIQKVMLQQDRLFPTAATSLILKADYALHKVLLEDICYIEGLDDYVKIHRKTQKPLVARITLKAIVEKLPAQQFVRVHRSFIVPLKEISAVRNRVISIAGVDITIGSKYEARFFQLFKG